MVEPLSDMAFAELRLRDLAGTPPEVLDHHFEAWFASRLDASGVNLPVDVVSSLKKAAKAALLSPWSSILYIDETIDSPRRTPYPWIDVDAPFAGSGEYSCRVSVTTTWLGLECEFQKSTPHAQDKRLIKVRRPVVDQNTPTGDVRVFTTERCRTYVEASKGSRGYKPSWPWDIRYCDACGVENNVPGGWSNGRYCMQCLDWGACPEDPDGDYTRDPYND